jgi:uncharacterized protein
MLTCRVSCLVAFVACVGFSQPSYAEEQERHGFHCLFGSRPQISFIEIQSLDLTKQPPAPLTVKGKLQMPGKCRPRLERFTSDSKRPAVVILHGSSGVDSRGDFYAQALNAAGIATLEIDMWEARGVIGVSNRPRVPIITYPDAFAALRFLTNQPSIDPTRIGVLGFSWGGVMSLAAAEQLYAAQFGGGLRFAAHVAHYPICYGANNPRLVFPLSPAQAGTQILHLTGAPVLIQIGTKDDYDNGSQHCIDLANSVSSSRPVQVEAYDGAFHAWDRLQVPISGPDPFGNEGSILNTGVVPIVRIVPDVDQAYRSRHKVVRFFSRHL